MSFNFDDSADFLLDDSIVKKPKRLTNDASKKRQRKSKKQIAMLEEYYLKSENWSNEFVLEIAEQTGLAAKQVAKWLWDRNLKKKEEKGKQHKRIKTKEDDEDEPSDAPVEIKQEIKQEVKMETLEDKRDLADFKDKESIGTISMIDGLIASRPKEEPDIKPKTLDKLENESNFSSKNSAKSLSLRERCSKANKIRGLKIKAPSIDELIKKPNPIGQDATNNFISNLSVYSKDLVSLPNNTPKSNSVVNSATPSIFQQSLIRDDKKVFNFPLVFSRGQTPEVNQCTPNKNMFTFENIRSPNPFVGTNSPYKRFGGEYMLEVPSPYRPEYLLKNPGMSPAFNFNDSSYRK